MQLVLTGAQPDPDSADISIEIWASRALSSGRSSSPTTHIFTHTTDDMGGEYDFTDAWIARFGDQLHVGQAVIVKARYIDNITGIPSGFWLTRVTAV